MLKWRHESSTIFAAKNFMRKIVFEMQLDEKSQLWVNFFVLKAQRK
jgi:hypothetical protein